MKTSSNSISRNEVRNALFSYFVVIMCIGLTGCQLLQNNQKSKIKAKTSLSSKRILSKNLKSKESDTFELNSTIYDAQNILPNAETTNFLEAESILDQSSSSNIPLEIDTTEIGFNDIQNIEIDSSGYSSNGYWLVSYFCQLRKTDIH